MSSRGGAHDEVRILAPAKINLGLAVAGRRPDGYHELRTIFQTITLCDNIRLLRRGRGGLRVRCPELPGLGEGNLAYQAAEIFLRRTGIRGGIGIEIEKRIPVGGGLGGGSSDAAAVLLGACRLYGVRPPVERLREWAAALGSDVPFFITGGAAVGRGRGELLEPLAPWPAPVSVLVYAPREGLATASVYRGLDGFTLTSRDRPFKILLARWREGNLGRFGAALFNDLEAPAFTLAPGLSPAKEHFRKAGAAGTLLSGSGSCFFGLFPGPAEAGKALRRLRGQLPGRFFRVRFLQARRRWGVVKR